MLFLQDHHGIPTVTHKIYREVTYMWLSEVTACVGGARLQSHKMEIKCSSTSPCNFNSSSSLVVLIEEIILVFIYNDVK